MSLPWGHIASFICGGWFALVVALIVFGIFKRNDDACRRGRGEFADTIDNIDPVPVPFMTELDRERP